MADKRLIEELKREVVLQPGNAELRFHLAEMLMQAEEYGAAAKQAKKAIELTATTGGSLREAARHLLMQALERLGDTREAFKMLEEKLLLDPDDMTTRDELIEVFVSFGRLDDAIFHAEQGLKYRPNELKRHLDIAEWCVGKRLFPRAKLALEAAMKLAPEDPAIASKLRDLYLEMGDEASADRMAGARDREYFLAQAQKALALPSVQKLVAEAGPQLASVARLLADGNATQARRDIGSVGLANKSNTIYWLLRAEIQLVDGDYEAAEISLREMTELAPGLGIGWNRLGDLHQVRGQFRKAVDCYKKAILLDKDDANAYEDLADVLQTIGETEEAMKMYRAAAKRDPQSRAEAKLRSLEDPQSDRESEKPRIGRIHGLAWNQVGGSTLPIGALAVIGHGNLIISGNVGDKLKESGQVAFSCLKAQAHELKIEQLVATYDLHLDFGHHQPTDGGSAGLAIALAGISAYTKRAIRPYLAASGAITIFGEVQPVSGLHEKLVAAVHSGVRTVILPRKSLRETRAISESVRRALELIYVDHISEAVPRALLSAEDFK